MQEVCNLYLYQQSTATFIISIFSVASRLVVDILQISETTAELLQKTGLNRHEANRAAAVIQKKFKKFIEIKYPSRVERKSVYF